MDCPERARFSGVTGRPRPAEEVERSSRRLDDFTAIAGDRDPDPGLTRPHASASRVRWMAARWACRSSASSINRSSNAG